MKKILFIDRDGTLIVEPPVTKQVNSLKELEFLPYAISSLQKFIKYGYEIVMVTNQDGLGTNKNSRENYDIINDKIFQILKNEGVEFYKVFECPHFEDDNCECRKPKIGILKDFLKNEKIDFKNSYMIGDRCTDKEFADNLNLKGIIINNNNNSWSDIVNQIILKPRISNIKRNTKETSIEINLNLDGSGKYNVNTGLKFFDHMLEQLAKHGGFDIDLICNGDLDIDEHHSIEDCAIVIGKAFSSALGDKRGIERYSWERILVMDEAKTEVSIDISNRPIINFDANFKREYVGDLPTEMVEHFFHTLCLNAGINSSFVITGKNDHHMIESCFKAFSRCLKEAVKKTNYSVSSTKGTL